MTAAIMIKYQQMKLLALVMSIPLASAASAAARLSVDALPGPVRPLAEAETNVSFNAGTTSDNLWRLSIALETTVINAVDVVLGTDVDGDGALSVDEGECVLGWRCGRWLWRDRRANAGGEATDASGLRRLDWTVRLDGDRRARSVAGNVFAGALPPTCFDAAWNMVRVVSRGADAVQVESKVTVDALELRVR